MAIAPIYGFAIWSHLTKDKPYSIGEMIFHDHTYSPGDSGSDHLSAHQVIEHVTRMREEDLMTDKAHIFATHIGHEGNPPHPELADFAARHGYEIAYDGLTV